jgi:hypothetical protein
MYRKCLDPEHGMTTAQKKINDKYRIHMGEQEYFPDFSNATRECTFEYYELLSITTDEYSYHFYVILCILIHELQVSRSKETPV